MSKPKRGRPASPSKRRQLVRMNFGVTEKTYLQIVQAASSQEVTNAQWMRNAIRVALENDSYVVED